MDVIVYLQKKRNHACVILILRDAAVPLDRVFKRIVLMVFYGLPVLRTPNGLKGIKVVSQGYKGHRCKFPY